MGRIESPTSLAAADWSILAKILIPFELSNCASLSIVPFTEWLLGKSTVPFAAIRSNLFRSIDQMDKSATCSLLHHSSTSTSTRTNYKGSEAIALNA